MRKILTLMTACALAGPAAIVFGAEKPPISFDAYFDSVSINDARIAPDGRAVVIETERAAWDQNRYLHDLWIWREGGAAKAEPLTRGGYDHSAVWSPDGAWVAFLSERSVDGDPADGKEHETARVWVISASGGEAFPVTHGSESVHAFAWGADSKAIYYATRTPWTKAQEDDYHKQWNDVVRYREAERGDTIFAAWRDASAGRETAEPRVLGALPYRVTEMTASPDGATLAIATGPPSERVESTEPYRIYLGDVHAGGVALLDHARKTECGANCSSPDSPVGAAPFALRNQSRKTECGANCSSPDAPVGAAPFALRNQSRKTECGANCSSPDSPVGAAPFALLSHTQAIYESLQWAEDGRSILFAVVSGSVEGPYRDVQPRLYSVEAAGAGRGTIHRWASAYGGAIAGYSVGRGGVLVLGTSGTQTQPYAAASASSPLRKLPGRPGAYARVSAARRSDRIALVYSSLQSPIEVYVAEGSETVAEAKPVTAMNAGFLDNALPRGKPYQWTADDGTRVEGMLIFPPGRFDAKGLRMLTLIHGGPADADEDRWGADWYDWAILAASKGWLVFRPNYRGSIGYGDRFALETIPHLVSRPGKDILEGVDALVKDGTADPAKLTIGGYSEGGYLTNWLITQTTRFKAAVTGAGAVEHVLNWGNDDETFDDASYLGGNPWEAEQNYNAEAAIWQVAKVRTPTHMVVGAADIRVHFGESYLLEHALRVLGVPCTLLVFPGEGHSLRVNPWHGKIKVREEMKWLEKYGGE